MDMTVANLKMAVQVFDSIVIDGHAAQFVHITKTAYTAYIHRNSCAIVQ